ncbi:proline--tRNA ligase [Paenibacillus sp. UMB4589-SE434]|uniref:proline--tRNA ligase n=1 Tax=Paenibacillus sp. UMB4589-SE434 TaxID=3046314 RepID=UPI0025505535|nr:proline--tRNA ligase [Paenibacillus sp. UMB4589-SE434]MDK8181901.1 proline--tRNA ligase [Paenibacillus sp. UMB4589-SE434]
MRQSQLLSPTLREAPADAEAVSHQLLLRAGYIRQTAAGVYSYLPLGRRMLRKLEHIVREEMDIAGAQEVLLPAIQPAELWQRSGRYALYGPELIRFHDRHEREFALGPTHEEVITTLVGGEVNSYRRLPLTMYQIQTKFRDERRPRFGLLRGREFLMKDAYSFDTDWEGLDRSYWNMYEAYHQIFTRMGLQFRAVEADPGSIGGEGGTHEFMALAAIGEDTIVSCSSCAYAANLEKAQSIAAHSSRNENKCEMTADGESITPYPVMTKLHTPNIRTIGQLKQALGKASQQMIKTLIYVADGQAVAVVVRGDHEVNEIKVKNTLGVAELQLADAETTSRVTGAPVGFAGPRGLSIPILVDEAVAGVKDALMGANEVDYHYDHVVPGRDFTLERIGDYRNAVEGDCCPRCESELQFSKGIEVGHIFKLGTKYSETLAATFLDTAGKEQNMVMGCYGIGISRLLSAAIEQHHDEHGIIWPLAIAPYQVHLVPVSVKDAEQTKVAEHLYEWLRRHHVEVLLDDRDERLGVKLKDADLMGIPLRIVIGKDAANGLVELKERSSGEKQIMTVEKACLHIQAVLEQV